MFENKYIPEWDCHYSRVIESWHKACRKNNIWWSTSIEFKRWLEIIEFRGHKLSCDDITGIMEIYDCGKMELETIADLYLKKTKDED